MIEFKNKAVTLSQLKPKLQKSRIADLQFFSRSAWYLAPQVCLEQIRNTLPRCPYIVRSSAHGEDSPKQSMAGKFLSILNVPYDKPSILASSINRVFSSYERESGNDYILIQPMIGNVAISGVVLTREQQSGNPYYTISYDDESGLTDTITSGKSIPKSLRVWRSAPMSWLTSPCMRKIVEAVQEIESLCGMGTLDIEFILDNEGVFWLLQVRPLILSGACSHNTEKKFSSTLATLTNQFKSFQEPLPNVYGRRAIFSNMSDWNPAEMIGTQPAPLAYSLYRHFITHSIWAQSRVQMGYKDMSDHELMASFAGHPMINLRLSFNSFLPAQTPDVIGERLIDAWMDRVEKNPEMHDKIEFDVATTCHTPEHREIIHERYNGLLSRDAENLYEMDLRDLTNNCVNIADSSTLVVAEKRARSLENIQRIRSLSDILQTGINSFSDVILTQINECKFLGTLPFAIAARHAFIAESLFRSLVSSNIIDQNRAQEIRQKIPTVADEIVRSIIGVTSGEISKEDFFSRYGHIRPGHYDILSSRYDAVEDFFDNIKTTRALSEKGDISYFSKSEKESIDSLFRSSGYTFNSNVFSLYLQKSIQMREWIKFIFTRHLSDIIEVSALLGEKMKLSREDVSYLTIEDILQGDISTDRVQQRKTQRLSQTGIHIPYLLSSERDFFVIPIQRNRPNFITDRHITLPAQRLTGTSPLGQELSGKIVCIEQADPGYDWIFACNVAGLVTKYGGSNSHMAIRCSEFSLPAAIGCGEVIYDTICDASYIELNCNAGYVRAALDVKST